MGRMLKALQQLEVRSPQPQPSSPPAQPEEPGSHGPPPPEDAPQVEAGDAPREAPAADTAVEAALAQVEIAAAAVRQEQEEDRADSPTASWPILSTAPHADAYRQLAENVLSQAPPDGGAALMFTSPSGGEGKTALLLSLAAALAERTAQRVLLLDGNLQKPDLAGCLGVEAARGLNHVLAGEATWQQVVQRTSIPRLDLLPGVTFPTSPAGPPEPLSLRPLLKQLRGHYRLVLIDTASLAHPEVAPLAQCCDGTYLVARLNHTTRRELAEAAEVLRDCRGNLLGGVVIGG
jgi:Mrp family chromosome partitioning ATPase